MKLNYVVPITQAASQFADSKEEFFIEGVAINAGITGNGHRFVEEELSKSAGTLKGRPLLVDHINSVSAIKGKVIEAYYDDDSKNVPFKAKVNDKEIQELIARGDLDSVSVGADVEDIVEEDGAYTLIGVKFRELSLVAVGADEMAGFTTAVREAYNKIHSPNSQSNKIDTKTIEKEVKKMSEENGKADEILKEKEAQIKELSTKVAAFEKKEREALEKKYNALCVEKSVKAKDSSTLSNEVLALLSEQLEQVKVKEDEDAVEPVADVKDNADDSDEADEDDSDEDVTEGYKLMQTHGSLRGGAYTLVR